MPAFVPVAQHKGGRADWLADLAIVDQLAAGLQAPSEEGVGCAADPHSARARRIQQAAALLTNQRQRLFVVDRFTRLDYPHTDLGVRVWIRQVDDDLDLWIGQQFLRGARFRHVVLCRLLLRPLHDEVRAGDDFQYLEGVASLEIDTADVATTDDADFGFGITHN